MYSTTHAKQFSDYPTAVLNYGCEERLTTARLWFHSSCLSDLQSITGEKVAELRENPTTRLNAGTAVSRESELLTNLPKLVMIPRPFLLDNI
jgi:hypothetical protein